MCKTVGIIVIADEVLKGRVVDENSDFLLKRMYALGLKVCKLCVIPDDVDIIAQEVAEFSRKYSFVITTGGTGATHDDVTYAGVAKAFREELCINKELMEWVYSFVDVRDSDITKNPALRMALVPESASLLYGGNRDSGKTFLDHIPVVCVSNVYIFPGIPSYLQNLFLNLEYIFKSNTENIFFDQSLYLNIGEMNYLAVLNCAVEKFHGSVTFGSYPIVDNTSYCSKISIESNIKNKVWEAEQFLIKQLPPESVVKKEALHSDDIISSVYCMEKLLRNNISKKVKTSIKIIEDCLAKYDFSEICISFNGGKDCTVLLHLTCAVIWHNKPELLHKKLAAVYIRYDDPFQEAEDFINDAIKRYNIKLKTIPGPIKSALGSLLQDEPKFKAILLGTRKIDPYSESLPFFQMTDPDWPQVMRVHPVIEWNYEDIWSFLRSYEIPYCNLYDKGYTSIGSRKNTTPNQKLLYKNDEGVLSYHPAYMLDDESCERSGRN